MIFSDSFCREIKGFLYFDVYLKSIVLWNNLLGEQGMEEVRYFMGVNRSLVTLDLR